MTEKINKEELSSLKHTKSLLKVLNFIVMPNVVATSECGYAFRLTFCHPANINRYAQIISGYVPDCICYVPYLRNSIPSDHNTWYTCVK